MKIGMMFPGYGSQYVGMLKDIYDESRTVQEHFEQAGHCLNINFVKLCFASSDIELSKMLNAYTSLFLVSGSLAVALQEVGVKPEVVAGYNIGQFAAMYAAKGITFADGLYILNKFSLYFQELLHNTSFAMARVIGCSSDELALLLKQVAQDQIQIAVYEMPHQHIISGPEDALMSCVQSIKDMDGTKVEQIAAEFGLYAQAMQPAIDAFKIYLEKVDFKDTTIPILSSISGKPIESGQACKYEVLYRATHPINWLASLKALHTCDILLSVGPGKTLATMAQRLYPNKTVMSVETLEDVQKLKELLGLQDDSEKLDEPQQPNDEPRTEAEF